ncbi:hypothetical protein BKA69DRAFT_1057838 [Paraphysoderma sedebokerense]|nr:hypothetical protein BKA69DRAFT_1057838 [Paraphysoderma sedebokerense]
MTSNPPSSLINSNPNPSPISPSSNTPVPSCSSTSTSNSNSTTQGPSNLYLFNSNKAGLDRVDKEKVNAIINEASKGSLFFKNEERKSFELKSKLAFLETESKKLRSQSLHHELKIVDNKLIELECHRDLSRVIVHIDMDAFYASVEERECPELKGKPMAVGGMSMLCTANYEGIFWLFLSKFGVRAAMPGYIAKKLCPQLILVPLHFDKYREASSQVRSVLAKYDPQFSPASLDEAYLDITGYLSTQGNGKTPEQVIRELRAEVFELTKLTCSAGIAANKSICSDMNKPNGQTYLPNERSRILEFMETLPIRKIKGIGKITEQMLQACGIVGCKDVYPSRAILYKLLTPKIFEFVLRASIGIGSTVVDEEWTRKSISVERTFSGMSDEQQLFAKLHELAESLAEDLEQEKLKGKTLTLKLKYTNFQVVTRAKTLPRFIYTVDDLYSYGKQILQGELPVKLRLMGLRMSALESRDKEGGIAELFKKQADASSPKRRRVEIQCPVCEMSLGRVSNEEINRHLDECTGSAGATGNGGEEGGALMVDCTEGEEDGCDQEEEIEFEVDGDDGASDCGTNVSAVEEEARVERGVAREQGTSKSGSGSGSQGTRGLVICPVCQGILGVVSNEALNAHVDLCLNRGVVSSVAERGGKREREGEGDGREKGREGKKANLYRYFYPQE